MSAANRMPFAGKWTLKASSGLWITLKDAATGELALEAAQSPGYNQQLNTYGNPAANLWLQGGNWNYVAYSGSGYFATEPWSGAPAEFLFEGVSGNTFRIVQRTGGEAFYLSANGSKLERIPKTGSPPGSTIFTQSVITPGLEQLESGAMGRNLRGVRFSGDDLTDFVFSGSDLSYAILRDSILKSATFQACTVEGTDFSGADLDDVVLTGIHGEKPRFDRATLRETSDLSGARIPGASFENAVSMGSIPGTGPTMNMMQAEGANFNGANLTAAVCNSGRFEDSQWNNVRLINAQAGNTRFDRASMNRIDCTGAALQTSYFDDAQLVGAEFQDADITGSSFKGANLTNARLSEVAWLTGIQLQRAQMVGTILTDLDLRSVGLDEQTVMMGAQMKGVDLTSQVLDGINFVRANLAEAKLDHTSMEDVVLVAAIMDRASATGNVSFVGADLSNSSMEGMKLNGAQMGAKSSVGVLPSGVVEGLNERRVPAEIHALLEGKGLRAGAAAKITVHEAGCEWILEDECGEFHLRALEGGVRMDQVGSIPAAILTNAYMPNADLTGANLYAVDMAGAHWYGSSARATDADMDLINFSHANLATMNFTQAQMRGANLSFAIVAGTNFTSAILTPTPQLRATSFSFASMQGADFTAAQLGGANLTNAAVSLKAGAPKEFVGIPLFPLETTFVDSLNRKKITAALRDSFAENGYPLADEASVTVDSPGVQWTISNRIAGSATLQAGYSVFQLWKRIDNVIEEIAVFGGSPVLLVRVGPNNEQEQAAIAFDPTEGLSNAMDDHTTTPSGMKLAMKDKGVAYEVLMTGGLPPHLPKCIPSPDRWC